MLKCWKVGMLFLLSKCCESYRVFLGLNPASLFIQFKINRLWIENFLTYQLF